MSGPSWDSPLVQWGLGAFETMRAVEGRIPLWPWHRRRLARALAAWGFPEEGLAPAEGELPGAPGAGLERVKLLVGLEAGDRLAWHVFRSPLSLDPRPRRLLLLETPFPRPAAYKSCSYDDHLLATRRARAAGLDDALHLGPDGRLLECGTAAVFLLQGPGGVAATGPALDSVTRRRLLEDGGGAWHEAAIRLDGLGERPRLAIGNALQGLAAVESVHDAAGRVLLRGSAAPEDLAPWNRLLFDLHA